MIYSNKLNLISLQLSITVSQSYQWPLNTSGKRDDFMRYLMYSTYITFFHTEHISNLLLQPGEATQVSNSFQTRSLQTATIRLFKLKFYDYTHSLAKNAGKVCLQKWQWSVDDWKTIHLNKPINKSDLHSVHFIVIAAHYKKSKNASTSWQNNAISF